MIHIRDTYHPVNLWRRCWQAVLAGFILLSMPLFACSGPTSQNDATTDVLSATLTTKDMNIKIVVEGQELTASLTDNEAARAFWAMLPLTVTLEDYAGTEKVCGLSKRLSSGGAPAGHNPEIGDITYYAPWGNLALFYRDFGYAEGLIKLGEITGDMRVFESSVPLKVTFEKDESLK